jgi:hypothetical protein
MEQSEVIAIIQQELPGLIAQTPQVRDFVLRTVSEYYAGKQETESKFDRVLAELQRDREEQARFGHEQHQENQATLARLDREWEENNRRWDENTRQWHENTRQWDENKRQWDENTRQWHEQHQENQAMLVRLDQEREKDNRRWDENTRQWHEQHQHNQEILGELKRHDRRYTSTIGALGSRWGIYSEASFRNALSGILTDSFGVQVLNLNLYDQEGEVFGRPDQVELDLIIQNGLTIACEIKSSIDKAGMYSFGRKVDFYAKHEGRQISRKMVISPMVDDRARPVAQALGIEVYSYADEVEGL